jgi:arginyl-tRNA synthetase
MSFQTQLLLKNKLSKTFATAVTKVLFEQYRELLGKAETKEDDLLSQLYMQVGDAPDLKMGHNALGLFPLAKILRGNPAKMSGEIAELLNNKNLEEFEKFEAKGPYLNTFYRKEFLSKLILEDLHNTDAISGPLYSGTPKTMIEYSQPNTHKILHVGHMRNLCMGNSLIRILKHSGYDVVAATYPGDVGTHVAKCLWYLKNIETETAPETNKGAWLGLIYPKANTLLEEQRGTDKEDENRKILTDILKQLHSGSGEYYDLWKETREWSLELMNEAYAWADVEFDRWFFESEVDAPSMKLANELLEKGLLVEDQGAVGMNLEDDKLGFCLLIKSDGTGLYSTKDVELARRKFEEFGIQKNIYIVDNRQSYHFKQVFKVLEKIGFGQAKDCFHLAYEMVELKDGAMASRKGNIVALMDLIQNMEESITKEYLEKYRGEWTDQEITETAKMVANGAVKYGMLRVDNNRKIIFDMEEWLRLDGETGPYLQYVHARINSLLQKAGAIDWSSLNYQVLDHQLEMALLLKLNQFSSTVAKSAESLKTLNLCAYLYELGKQFNSFYAECSVMNAENEEIKQARMALCFGVKEVMKKGLELLGIQAPEKM